MNFLLSSLRKAKLSLFFSILFGFGSGLANTGLLISINHLLVGKIYSFQLISYLCLLILIFYSEVCSQLFSSHLTQRVSFNLQLIISKNILNAPLRDIEKTGLSNINTLLTQDITVISYAIAGLPSLIINSVMIISCFIYLKTLSTFYFEMTFLFFLLALIIFIGLENLLIKNKIEVTRSVYDELVKRFHQLIVGIKELKLCQTSKDNFLKHHLIPAAEKYRNHLFSTNKLYSFMQSGWKINFFLLIGICLFITHQSNDSHFELIFMVIYLIPSLSGLVSQAPGIRRAFISAKKIKSLLLCPEIKNENKKISKITDWSNLEFRSIVYSYDYPADQFILGPINFSLHPNEIVFIAGENGTGKSTLAKIITGLYTPNHGKISIDQMSITPENIAWYREQFSVIFSDSFLFDALLNTSNQNSNINIQHYLNLLELQTKVTIQNNKFSTIDLSDGQKKRLALLRTYLEDRPIYLFDEWAAHQDTLFKSTFYQHLLPELKKKGKCIIVISHDDRYFSLADRIFRLKNGKLQVIFNSPPCTRAHYASFTTQH